MLNVVAGYQHDSGHAQPDGLAGTMNDAYFAAGAYPILNENDTGGFSRLGLFTQGRYVWDYATSTQGWGTSIQITGDLGTFFNERSAKHHDWEAAEPPYPCGSSGDTWGAIGETTLGVFAEAGYTPRPRRHLEHDVWLLAPSTCRRLHRDDRARLASPLSRVLGDALRVGRCARRGLSARETRRSRRAASLRR